MNVLAWNENERRTGSLGAFGTAMAVLVAALAVWWFVQTPPAWLYWALVGLLALVLAFTAVLLFVPARVASAEAQAPAADASAAHAPAAAAPDAAAAPAPAAHEPRVLTLRCGDCGTIFDVTDTGERPLYHTCPGCGAEGALRDAPTAEAEPTPAAAMEAPSPYAPPEAAPAPAPAAPAMEAAPAAPVKKMKLRCGGCKEVFTIEDTGERPLKRACPHCGRVGQIR